jgi:hypothetical protein
VSHTHACRFRTDLSTPRKLNLRKLAHGDGINRGGLQNTGKQQFDSKGVPKAMGMSVGNLCVGEDPGELTPPEIGARI